MTKSEDARLKLTVSILLVVYILNFLDRQIIGILAQHISQDLGLNDWHLGLMTGLAFALFYSGLGIPIARFADRPRTDRIQLIALCLAIWSAMTALCGAAQNFTQLFLARIGVGIGEAGGTPPVHSLIAEMAPPEKRSSAMALYMLGPPLGGLIGMVLGGYLADSIGWRWAFALVGAPGILLSLVLVALLRDPRRDNSAKPVQMAPQPPFWDAVRQILASRANRMILVSVAFSATANYGMMIWGPTYLQRSFGISASQTGLWFGLANGLGAAIGVWSGGQLADRLRTRGKQHLMTAPAISIGISSPLLVLGLMASDWQLAVALFFPGIAFLWLHVGPVHSTVQGLVPPTCRATASASILLMQNVFGLAVAVPAIGWLSDQMKADYGVDSVRAVLTVAMGLATLTAAVFFWLSRRHLPNELDRYS